MLRPVLEKILSCVAGIGLVIFAGGCNINAPRPRMGTLPTPPPGPRFLDPDNLGKHSYHFSPFEKNGIVYTCKAGHLDITHIRWAADHTKYLVKRTRETLMKKGVGFTFVFALEASRHKAKFRYPENWDDLSREEKKRIANEISLQIGPYLAFNATLWHEIITWFDVHFIGFEPEFNSSFSWEDVYSNLLGTKLAVEALKDTNHKYDEAMALVIDRELKRLGVRSKRTAINASEKMRGKWFTGILLVDITRKNIDIGLDDGSITPVLVPGICEDAEPEPCLVPTTDILSKYGFSMRYEIYPQEWEKERFLKVIYPDGKAGRVLPVLPHKHFPAFMDYIKKQAVEKYGYDIG